MIVGSKKKNIKAGGSRKCISYQRLLVGLALATIILTLLVMSFNPGSKEAEGVMLTQALLSEKADLGIDSQVVASRIVEQKFQIHMQETDQQMGEIPSVEVWVLNDPFYPLIGDVADLRSDQGTIASKEWQMLGFPDYKQGTTSTSSTSTTTTTSTTSPSVTSSSATSGTQTVVMVQEIYEIRGIRYAKIKVNDNSYDRLKAGSDFADVLRVQEIKDGQTVVVLCGDENYELKVGELRKI
jgi:hypothetical protein